MKKVKRLMIIGSLFLIPLLSLGQDASSVTHDFSQLGADKLGRNASLENGIIIVLFLIFSYEVYKFYLGQKKSREQEELGVDSDWN